jgi:hypothetical protein
MHKGHGSISSTTNANKTKQNKKIKARTSYIIFLKKLRCPSFNCEIIDLSLRKTAFSRGKVSCLRHGQISSQHCEEDHQARWHRHSEAEAARF